MPPLSIPTALSNCLPCGDSRSSSPENDAQNNRTSRTQNTGTTPPSAPRPESPSARARLMGSTSQTYGSTSTSAVGGKKQAQTAQQLKQAQLRKTADAGTQTSRATQTHPCETFNYHTIANVFHMFNGFDDQRPIGLAHDPEVVQLHMAVSAVPMPKGQPASAFLVSPPDLMGYYAKDEGGKPVMKLNCPELNGTGFGGTRDLPPELFDKMLGTAARTAREINVKAKQQKEVPLIIINNSGREGAERTNGKYAQSAGSKMIHEKAKTAEVMAEALGSIENPVHVQSMDTFITDYYKAVDPAKAEFEASDKGPEAKDKFEAAKAAAYEAATEAMAEHADKPLVLLSYSRDFAECCKIDDDGRPRLFGRPVHGALNDRAVMNLEMSEGKKVDYKKTTLMNPMVQEGVDKFAAAMVRDEFHKSEAAKALPALAEAHGFKYDVAGLDQSFHFERGGKEQLEGMTKTQIDQHRLTYFRGVTEAEGMDGVRAAVEEFRAIGLKPLFKPNGTGQSKGIIMAKNDETVDEFITRFEENMAGLEKDFGKGAGYPFLVMPTLSLATAEDPKEKVQVAFDMRWAVIQDSDDNLNRTVHSIPLIAKREPPPEGKAKGTGAPNIDDPDFSPTNVTAATKKTGRPGTDFIDALSHNEKIEAAGLTQDQALSVSMYFSHLNAWILENKYPQ